MSNNFVRPPVFTVPLNGYGTSGGGGSVSLVATDSTLTGGTITGTGTLGVQPNLSLTSLTTSNNISINGKLIFPGGGIGTRGSVSLTAGSAGVSTAQVTTGCLIVLSGDTSVVGYLRASALTPGVGFTILSSNGADNGNVNWVLIF